MHRPHFSHDGATNLNVPAVAASAHSDTPASSAEPATVIAKDLPTVSSKVTLHVEGVGEVLPKACCKSNLGKAHADMSTAASSSGAPVVTSVLGGHSADVHGAARDDQASVIVAVSVRGLGLQHASMRLRGDFDVVRAAMRQNSGSEWFASL